jgi:hypothetical protein
MQRERSVVDAFRRERPIDSSSSVTATMRFFESSPGGGLFMTD